MTIVINTTLRASLKRGRGCWRSLLLPTTMQDNLLWSPFSCVFLSSLYTRTMVSILSHADYIDGQSNCLIALYLYNGWQLQASSASSLPFFRLARKVVCITMVTYYEWHFIILLYLFRQREGRVGAVPIENLCCASVLSDSQAIRRSESLASARHNEERERVFYRYCPCSPLYNVWTESTNYQTISVSICSKWQTSTTTNWNLTIGRDFPIFHWQHHVLVY